MPETCITHFPSHQILEPLTVLLAEMIYCLVLDDQNMYIIPFLMEKSLKFHRDGKLMLKVQALFTSILYEKYAQKLILPYRDRKDCRQIFSVGDICLVPDLAQTGSNGKVPRHGIVSIQENSSWRGWGSKECKKYVTKL